MNALLDHDFETERRRHRLSFSQALTLSFLPGWAKRRRFEERRSAAAENTKPAATAVTPWPAQRIRRV